MGHIFNRQNLRTIEKQKKTQKMNQEESMLETKKTNTEPKESTKLIEASTNSEKLSIKMIRTHSAIIMLMLLLNLLLFQRPVDANNIGCYVSRIDNLGVNLYREVATCDEYQVILGNKIDRLEGLEHKDSPPSLFVAANVDHNFTVKNTTRDGLKLDGPRLFQLFFISKDNLVCVKMSWKCKDLKHPNGTNGTNARVRRKAKDSGKIVTFYGVALEGRKAQMCEGRENCTFNECDTHLCNSATSTGLFTLRAVFQVICWAIMAILAMRVFNCVEWDY